MNRLLSGTIEGGQQHRAFALAARPVLKISPEKSQRHASPMFKRSFLLVSMIILLVFASAFTSQMMMTRDLPSAFDPGVTIDQALKSSKVPLLIEFYSDTCGTCKRLAPIVHELEGDYKDRLTLVMLDIDDPDNKAIAQLFGVNELPGIFVFDFRKMKKFQIESKDFISKGTLQQAIDEVLSKSLLSTPGSGEILKDKKALAPSEDLAG